MAKIGVSQERTNAMIVIEKTISTTRFNKRLKGSFKGMVLKVKIGMTP
jgi:hypothetical protein